MALLYLTAYALVWSVGHAPFCVLRQGGPLLDTRPGMGEQDQRAGSRWTTANLETPAARSHVKSFLTKPTSNRQRILIYVLVQVRVPLQNSHDHAETRGVRHLALPVTSHVGPVVVLISLWYLAHSFPSPHFFGNGYDGCSSPAQQAHSHTPAIRRILSALNTCTGLRRSACLT